MLAAPHLARRARAPRPDNACCAPAWRPIATSSSVPHRDCARKRRAPALPRVRPWSPRCSARWGGSRAAAWVSLLSVLAVSVAVSPRGAAQRSAPAAVRASRRALPGRAQARVLLRPAAVQAAVRLVWCRARLLGELDRWWSPVHLPPDQNSRSSVPAARPRRQRESKAPARSRRPSAAFLACGVRSRIAMPHSRHFLGFQSDQRHMQIAGTAQIIHQRHQITIRNRFVGAYEHALLLVAGGRLIERSRKRRAAHRIVVDQQAQVGFERQKQRLVRARLLLGTGGR